MRLRRARRDLLWDGLVRQLLFRDVDEVRRSLEQHYGVDEVSVETVFAISVGVSVPAPSR
jgi:hypothetical protein